MTLNDFKNKLLTQEKDEEIGLKEIESSIIEYFINKPMPHLQSQQMFVVRCSVNQPGEVFKTASRCSYPPDEYKSMIKIQRGNYPGQQVFYCSMPTNTEFADASLTCIVETAWEHIEDLNSIRTYLTLSRWNTIRPLNFWVLPFSDESCKKNNDFNGIRENMIKLIKEGDYHPEAIKALEFISDSFCERKNKNIHYRITSAFNNALLYFETLGNNNIYDGLMYPSANTESAGLNMAIKKELIDNHTLVFDRAIMYSMQRYPNNPKGLNIMPCSNESFADTDGKLHFTTII